LKSLYLNILTHSNYITRFNFLQPFFPIFGKKFWHGVFLFYFTMESKKGKEHILQ